MNGMIIGIIIVFGATMAFFVWALICNERTVNDRHALTDFVFSKTDYRPLLRAYDRVSYDQHLKARFWFKSPASLYDEPLRSFLASSPAVREQVA